MLSRSLVRMCCAAAGGAGTKGCCGGGGGFSSNSGIGRTPSRGAAASQQGEGGDASSDHPLKMKASFYVFATLVHPREIVKVDFGSEKWRLSMHTLYRVILKLHRIHLQPIQQQFGDRFVQAEFHRHMDASEKYARLFYESWYGYCAQLTSGATSREMTEEEKQLLTPEQRDTLRDLRSYVVRMHQADGNFML